MEEGAIFLTNPHHEALGVAVADWTSYGALALALALVILTRPRRSG